MKFIKKEIQSYNFVKNEANQLNNGSQISDEQRDPGIPFCWLKKGSCQFLVKEYAQIQAWHTLMGYLCCKTSAQSNSNKGSKSERKLYFNFLDRKQKTKKTFVAQWKKEAKYFHHTVSWA